MKKSISEQITGFNITKNEFESLLKNRLSIYQNLNSLEKTAMYLGVAQLVELDLKNLIASRQNNYNAKLSKLTLGQVVREPKPLLVA